MQAKSKSVWRLYGSWRGYSPPRSSAATGSFAMQPRRTVTFWLGIGFQKALVAKLWKIPQPFVVGLEWQN